MNESGFHPEDKARSLIDRRLVACGWLIQSKADMNLGAGLGVAVREFQTASGPVDYGLFVGRKLCGVIEAKAEGTTLSGYSEQAARYIADVPKHLVREEGRSASNMWRIVEDGCGIIFRSLAGLFLFRLRRIPGHTFRQCVGIDGVEQAGSKTGKIDAAS
jgi:type I site-specific restriction endonuclease